MLNHNIHKRSCSFRNGDDTKHCRCVELSCVQIAQQAANTALSPSGSQPRKSEVEKKHLRWTRLRDHCLDRHGSRALAEAMWLATSVQAIHTAGTQQNWSGGCEGLQRAAFSSYRENLPDLPRLNGGLQNVLACKLDPSTAKLG